VTDGTPADVTTEAERVITAAQALPDLGTIKELAEEAIRHGPVDHMSREQVQELAKRAVAQAEQLAALLQQLSGLLGAGDTPGGVTP
jgi:hypothetical protein